MLPDLFRIPFVGWRIHSFGVLVVLGFLAGYWFVRQATARDGIPREKIQDLPIWMVLSGLIGARLFYVVQFYDESFRGADWHHAFRIWEGGLVFYGGLILAAPVFVIYCRRHGLPLLSMLDAMAPATALGLGFGRIGCFLNGCCYGRECAADFPLGVRYPADSLPMAGREAGAWLHPTQLYESLLAFAMALLLWAIWRRRVAPGAVLAALFLLYGTGRFLLEGIRGDHGVPLGGWTVSRWISLATATIGAAIGLALAARIGARESAPADSRPPLAGAQP